MRVLETLLVWGFVSFVTLFLFPLLGVFLLRPSVCTMQLSRHLLNRPNR
jgi:hypothetical protein